MKKITIAFTLGLIVALGFSFKTIYDLKQNSAEANELNGILMFTDSKPLMKYEIIGQVKLGLGSTHKDCYRDARVRLVEICKEKYPTGKGLMIKVDEFRYTADVIDFKE
jgi:hypothetical protein